MQGNAQTMTTVRDHKDILRRSLGDTFEAGWKGMLLCITAAAEATLRQGNDDAVKAAVKALNAIVIALGDDDAVVRKN